MATQYDYIQDLAGSVEIPPDGTLSRTVYADEQVKAVMFAFDAGQELSEHKASMPAIIHVLKGEARLVLAGDERQAGTGTWVHMPANLSHTVYASTPLVMLLLLLKNPRPEGEDGSK